ncbi:MAG: hypothetical protein OEY64_03280 [Nitrospinota bacterium]|nr:hypothetical protein [Nitrospinota bacterium]
MGIETEADLDTFLSTSGFGVTGLYNGNPVKGILNKRFVEVGNIEGYHPVFTVKRSQFPTVKKGDEITIESVVYTVSFPEPDGTTGTVGLVDLVLREK